MAKKADPIQSLDDISTAADPGPVRLVGDQETGDKFLIYATEQGIKVELHYQSETLWMTQAQIADLFGRDVSVISRHIANVISEGELAESEHLQKMQIASSTRPVTLYSLDMVISVGYRVSSQQATLFRRWATSTLVQFAKKGFVVDVERLKSPDGSNHFAELREIIRDIRASESNVYKEVRRICALCSDYQSIPDEQKNRFFATIQNKLHYAKNFLGEAEIRDLNRFTGMLLDYFEKETDLNRLVVMSDAEKRLDLFIINNERPLLRNAGSVSKKAADTHSKKQYEIFNERRRQLRHDDAMQSD